MWLFTADTSFPPTNLKYTPFELCVHRGNAFLCLQTMQLTVVNSQRSGHVCVTFNYVFILYKTSYKYICLQVPTLNIILEAVCDSHSVFPGIQRHFGIGQATFVVMQKTTLYQTVCDTITGECRFNASI